MGAEGELVVGGGEGVGGEGEDLFDLTSGEVLGEGEGGGGEDVEESVLGDAEVWFGGGAGVVEAGGEFEGGAEAGDGMDEEGELGGVGEGLGGLASAAGFEPDAFDGFDGFVDGFFEVGAPAELDVDVFEFVEDTGAVEGFEGLVEAVVVGEFDFVGFGGEEVAFGHAVEVAVDGLGGTVAVFDGDSDDGGGEWFVAVGVVAEGLVSVGEFSAGADEAADEEGLWAEVLVLVEGLGDGFFSRGEESGVVDGAGQEFAQHWSHVPEVFPISTGKGIFLYPATARCI